MIKTHCTTGNHKRKVSSGVALAAKQLCAPAACQEVESNNCRSHNLYSNKILPHAAAEKQTFLLTLGSLLDAKKRLRPQGWAQAVWALQDCTCEERAAVRQDDALIGCFRTLLILVCN